MDVEPHIYNPKNLPVDTLPVIYGFPTARYGHMDWLGMALAEDGTKLAQHVSSCEGWLAIDLGTSKHGNPHRHEAFDGHYPDGYRTEYVEASQDGQHMALYKAIALFEVQNSPEEAAE